MNIKKIGHCCLLIKTDKITILTDPGMFSTGQNTVTGIDLVLITHEHADHFHIESLKEVLKNNPQAQVITNSGVGAKLKEQGINFSLLEGNASSTIKEVLIEAFDGKHEEIFEEFGQVQNTGYFVDNKLFYPGDSYIDPKKSVDVLALPVAGPWCRIKNSIEYAMRLKPRIAFPVHDGQLIKEKIGGFHGAPQNMLPKNGIEFVIMNEGDEKEF